VSVLIDPPFWPAHGRLWSHLVSDSSLQELHDFAAAAGIPVQAFDRDHYDVPAEAYDRLVAAGAEAVPGRELVTRLQRAGLRRRRLASPGRRQPGQALLRPARMQPGAVVAVVAPSGPVPSDRLERGLSALRGWGLRVRLGHHVTDRDPRLPHLAGVDAQRRADLEAAWTAPDVAAVWCARGGFGSHRLVDGLNWTAMADAGPKLLVGFSDITALHEAVNGRLGVVSIHGPVVTSLPDASPEATEHLHQLLFAPDRAGEPFTGVRLRRVVGGRASGVLTGGNLRVLTASLGTRLSRPARGGIVVLEDVGEAAYRIDGMLTQLLRSGWFDGVRAVVTGGFTDTGEDDDANIIAAVLADRLGHLGVPVVSGAPFGHVPDNRALPLGAAATLDADAGTLRLGEPALR
jgi:muramoyltetrapeptide carboxypeptidase